MSLRDTARMSAGRLTLPLSALHESSRNARRIGDDAVRAVRDSITQFGLRQPIVVAADGEIIAGHTRARACRELGIEEVWVEIADSLTPEQVRAYRLADNRTGEYSQWDISGLRAEVSDLAAAGVDMESLPGFDADLTAALSRIAEAMPEVDAPEVEASPPEPEDPDRILQSRKKVLGRDRLIGLKWPGGKSRILNWLLPLFPREGVRTFVDLFGGGGAVILNVQPRYPVEIYNDRDGCAVRFFRVLRTQPDELIRRLRLTPHSRSEFQRARTETGHDEVERARLFFVLVEQSILARRHSWVTGVHTAAHAVSQRNIVDQLDAVAERLREVTIENQDALRLIEKTDGPRTLFYADPPYPERARKVYGEYGDLDMSDADHRALAAALRGIKGRAVITGYENDLYHDIFAGWRCETYRWRGQSRVSQMITEAAWLNF